MDQTEGTARAVCNAPPDRRGSIHCGNLRPGAGTDRTRDWSPGRGPIVVLVEPQLGENIGAAARAMANFGLSQLRLVNPRQGWPNDKARMMATGAGRVLDGAA